jgi:transposase InsO family protein
MRYEFIENHRTEHSICLMCKVLEVSSSGFYAWRGRPESQRRREDRKLKVLIRAAFFAGRKSYGTVRIQGELLDHGIHCGRQRIGRLMKEEGLVPKKARLFRRTTISAAHHTKTENVLNRQFSVESPDQVWAGDITYLRAGGSWLYLAVILDLFSRRVVGWSISSSLSKELAQSALNKALLERAPGPGLLHHSDRGSQYTSTEYQTQLKKNRVAVSMSRKGDCWDNAVVESFFATLKLELGDTFSSRRAAQAALFDYIEIFYNRQRRHTTIGGMAPAQFEDRFSMPVAA